MNLLLELFGDWTGSRLGPRRFAILWLLLFVEVIVGLLLTVLVVLADSNWSFDLYHRHAAPTIAAMTFMISVLLFFAGMFNISLKRGRDIGVPGFVTAILFFVALMLGGVPMIFNILLALVPENTIGLKSA